MDSLQLLSDCPHNSIESFWNSSDCSSSGSDGNSKIWNPALQEFLLSECNDLLKERETNDLKVQLYTIYSRITHLYLKMQIMKDRDDKEEEDYKRLFSRLLECNGDEFLSEFSTFHEFLLSECNSLLRDCWLGRKDLKKQLSTIYSSITDLYKNIRALMKEQVD